MTHLFTKCDERKGEKQRKMSKQGKMPCISIALSGFQSIFRSMPATFPERVCKVYSCQMSSSPPPPKVQGPVSCSSYKFKPASQLDVGYNLGSATSINVTLDKLGNVSDCQVAPLKNGDYNCFTSCLATQMGMAYVRSIHSVNHVVNSCYRCYCYLAI